MLNNKFNYKYKIANLLIIGITISIFAYGISFYTNRKTAAELKTLSVISFPINSKEEAITFAANTKFIKVFGNDIKINTNIESINTLNFKIWLVEFSTPFEFGSPICYVIFDEDGNFIKAKKTESECVMPKNHSVLDIK